MRKTWYENLAGFLLIAVLAGLPGTVLAYQFSRVSETVIIRVDQQYGFRPGAIYVKPGEAVKLELHADDVIHGFQSRELNVKVDQIYPGKPVTVRFTAPAEPGEYGFACAKMCGSTHGDMLGKIVVLP